MNRSPDHYSNHEQVELGSKHASVAHWRVRRWMAYMSTNAIIAMVSIAHLLRQVDAELNYTQTLAVWVDRMVAHNKGAVHRFGPGEGGAELIFITILSVFGIGGLKAGDLKAGEDADAPLLSDRGVYNNIQPFFFFGVGVQ